MGTVRKTITLTEKQDAWVKKRIACGDFTNDSEYIRALVRRDQENAATLASLRNAITEPSLVPRKIAFSPIKQG